MSLSSFVHWDTRLCKKQGFFIIISLFFSSRFFCFPKALTLLSVCISLHFFSSFFPMLPSHILSLSLSLWSSSFHILSLFLIVTFSVSLPPTSSSHPSLNLSLTLSPFSSRSASLCIKELLVASVAVFLFQTSRLQPTLHFPCENFMSQTFKSQRGVLKSVQCCTTLAPPEEDSAWFSL